MEKVNKYFTIVAASIISGMSLLTFGILMGTIFNYTVISWILISLSIILFIPLVWIYLGKYKKESSKIVNKINKNKQE